MLIAFLRIMKLIRFGEVKRSLGLIVKKQEERNKHSYVHSVQVFYQLLMAT